VKENPRSDAESFSYLCTWFGPRVTRATGVHCCGAVLLCFLSSYAVKSSVNPAG
jgi:hypothetical protein